MFLVYCCCYFTLTPVSYTLNSSLFVQCIFRGEKMFANTKLMIIRCLYKLIKLCSVNINGKSTQHTWFFCEFIDTNEDKDNMLADCFAKQAPESVISSILLLHERVKLRIIAWFFQSLYISLFNYPSIFASVYPTQVSLKSLTSIAQ